MRIGVIGTGTIGSMLATAFHVNPDHEIWVHNRTREKAIALARTAPNIRVASDLPALVKHSDLVFLCTKAQDGRQVTHDLAALLQPHQMLAVTISSIPVSWYEHSVPCPVAKVIPSVLQAARTGVMLVCHGERASAADKARLNAVLSEIAIPREIREDQIRIASDLTSCGPAFLAALLQHWAAAAEATGKLSREEAEQLLRATVTGVAQLLEGGMTFSDIIQRVCVPGGVTEAGLVSIGHEAPEVFNRLHQTTQMFSQGSMLVVHLG
ncbi:pyrroline-5-carboxylate reductase dimerization domain-containing protein [Alicyclobacillus sp.]|uniref:pyrroline-5-carboxylate reductase dimerization domain-containing protein n=1 Tax=Alicyclobacillus sp. TaxID=61169 RepID=UPI0025C21C08|nr:pyrroline-5-carboxylate reductase dimerization domain-containing protein [Alicyclobacillus sp.]MCL6516720.1 NAD(P)-binding domain-containing protein [Alicyclobacillus sp.]